jgi:hypothetical protein
MNRLRSALGCAAAGLATLVVAALLPAPAQAEPVLGWPHVITNLNSGQCLGVYAGDMTNGTPVVQFPCVGHLDQNWAIDTFGGSGGWTRIRNIANQNKCLGVLASGAFDGANLVIWDCNGSTDQLWWLETSIPVRTLHSAGSWSNGGCFAIVNYNASAWPGTTGVDLTFGIFPRVMGVLGGSTAPLAQTVVWQATNAPDQWWCVT